MKTKKIVIGAMAAAMLSLSVCSIAPAVAAGETVQISVSETTAEAGGQFTVDVSLADIPATGIQACQFTVEYDSSVLTVTEVKAGNLAVSVSGDSSTALVPSFNSFTENEGSVSVMWSTSLDDNSSWMKGEGTFCTISGTVADNATPGTVAKINVVPTNRETHEGSGENNDQIDCGYLDASGARVNYDVKIKSGSVTVAGGESSVPDGKYLKGDANVDGKVTVADAVAILQSIGNKDKYELKPQGKINGDVDGIEGITANDALRIQQLDAGVIKEL